MKSSFAKGEGYKERYTRYSLYCMGEKRVLKCVTLVIIGANCSVGNSEFVEEMEGKKKWLRI